MRYATSAFATVPLLNPGGRHYVRGTEDTVEQGEIR